MNSVSKENLILIINETNCLLYDTSVFTVLAFNNPADKSFERLQAKGYSLTALGALTVLGLYSRIYYALKIEKVKKLTEAQETAYDEIVEVIKKNKLKGYFIAKSKDSILSSDEDFFERFIVDLAKDADLDLGLTKISSRTAWKQVRNMISHATFPLATVGGSHVDAANTEAIKDLKLPMYEIEPVLQTIRTGFLSKESFQWDGENLRVNGTVLLAYTPLIRDFLLEQVSKADDASCDRAFKSFNDLVNRQRKSQ